MLVFDVLQVPSGGIALTFNPLTTDLPVMFVTVGLGHGQLCLAETTMHVTFIAKSKV
jgi:hypothetical protein